MTETAVAKGSTPFHTRLRLAIMRSIKRRLYRISMAKLRRLVRMLENQP